MKRLGLVLWALVGALTVSMCGCPHVTTPIKDCSAETAVGLIDDVNTALATERYAEGLAVLVANWGACVIEKVVMSVAQSAGLRAQYDELEAIKSARAREWLHERGKPVIESEDTMGRKKTQGTNNAAVPPVEGKPNEFGFATPADLVEKPAGAGVHTFGMKPSIGRTVHYELAEYDAEQINRRRVSGEEVAERMKGGHWHEGAQAHVGNVARAGDVFPMVIVRVWDDSPTGAVNGRVLLDGSDDLWVTSRTQVVADSTDRHGHWFAPPRV